MQFRLKEKQNINSTALHNIRILLQSDTVWNLNFLRIIEEYLSKKILAFTMRIPLLHIFLVIVLLIISIGYASGTPPEEQWNKTYGRSDKDRAKVVQQTSDSGYIIAGRTGLCQICPDVWVIKTDSKGNEQWNKTFGKTGNYYISFLQQTSDDGYILSGKNESWLHGKSSFWLIKTDSKGNEQWNKTYGNVIKGRRFVHQTSDGGYFIAVTTSSCNDKCPENIWLVKLNSKGEEQWNKTIGGNERIKYAHQTSDGAFIIVRIDGSLPFFKKRIEKIDPDGNIQWSKSFVEGYVSYVQHTSDDGYIIATRNTYYSKDSDLMLIRIDSNAEEQWNKTIKGTIGRGVSIIRQTSDSGYILGGTTYTGTFHVDFWLMKIDPEGQEQWNMTYGGAGYEWIDSIYQINDGSYIIGCDVFPMFALIKINQGGEIQWI